ncbi:MAG: hypothetical protein JO331_06130 [Verrucomicrobia bacterium]|nr:hypothetical protein [Verrucomicrobiota bacterium]
MKRHLRSLPSPSSKTRRPSSRAKRASSPSISDPKTETLAPAKTAQSRLTNVEKAGAAGQGVAKGLAAGFGTELALGFVAGATGLATSTILWMLLPFPIYAIATKWKKIRARAGRLCVGKGTLHDYKAAGEIAGGFISVSAAGPEAELKPGQAVGEAFGALCGDESQEGPRRRTRKH